VVEQTGIGLVMVSHLKRPEGRGHEEGAQVSLGHLRGSQAIAQLSDMVIGAERNQQGNAAERNELQLRVLKNRFSGATGPCDKLVYNQDTGRLVVPMSHYFGT
jgi:twinkle protein